MINDLIKVANSLDLLGLNKEADKIDLIIQKIAKSDQEYQVEKGVSQKHPTSLPHINFEWPWETWNKLPAASREDVYDVLDTLSWIPILGLGSLSAEFTLRIFAKEWDKAAMSLLFIIINFVFVYRATPKINLLKNTGKITTDIWKTILTNTNTKSIVLDELTNVAQETLESIASAFQKKSYTQPLAQNLRGLKGNVRGMVLKEMEKRA